MTTLHGRMSQNLPLSDALIAYIELLNAHENAAQLLAESVALLYSPKQCEFAKLQDRNLKNPKGGLINLSLVFEARVFNSLAELRWLNKNSGRGQAVLLSEASIDHVLDDPIQELHALDRIEQTYMLWGQGIEVNPHPSPSGWSRLTEARIGRLDVPIANLQNQQRVQLIAREYVAEVDEYGNTAVVEERLVKLEVH
jgi:CRISPR-associated protein (TIGR03984 family)